MKPCAIVILNFNEEEMLKTFLPSVCTLSTHDIWVIDNASTDGSIKYIKDTFPAIELIQLTENYGYAGGYNHGLQSLKDSYEFYILLNSDVAVSPNWDEHLISWMQANPAYAALQPKILSYADRAVFDYAGAGGGFLDAYAYPYCRGRIWDTIEQDQGQYNDDIDVDWASGACMVVRSAAFHAMGGFDLSFFAHMEEIDLCWRMRTAGWKIGYKGSVEVYHLGGATLDRASPRKLYLNIRNSLSMVYKNETASRFKKVFVVKSMLEHLAAWTYVLKGQVGHSKAIRQGYRDFESIRSSMVQTQIPNVGVDMIPRQGKVTLIFWKWKVLGIRKYSDL